MNRADRIRAAIEMGASIGVIDGYYCQSRMPGRRWTIWGRVIGAYEYAGRDLGSIERSYSTREAEQMLRTTGLLGE